MTKEEIKEFKNKISTEISNELMAYKNETDGHTLETASLRNFKYIIAQVLSQNGLIITKIEEAHEYEGMKIPKGDCIIKYYISGKGYDEKCNMTFTLLNKWMFKLIFVKEEKEMKKEESVMMKNIFDAIKGKHASTPKANIHAIVKVLKDADLTINGLTKDGLYAFIFHIAFESIPGSLKEFKFIANSNTIYRVEFVIDGEKKPIKGGVPEEIWNAEYKLEDNEKKLHVIPHVFNFIDGDATLIKISSILNGINWNDDPEALIDCFVETLAQFGIECEKSTGMLSIPIIRTKIFEITFGTDIEKGIIYPLSIFNRKTGERTIEFTIDGKSQETDTESNKDKEEFVQSNIALFTDRLLNGRKDKLKLMDEIPNKESIHEMLQKISKEKPDIKLNKENTTELHVKRHIVSPIYVNFKLIPITNILCDMNWNGDPEALIDDLFKALTAAGIEYDQDAQFPTSMLCVDQYVIVFANNILTGNIYPESIYCKGNCEKVFEFTIDGESQETDAESNKGKYDVDLIATLFGGVIDSMTKDFEKEIGEEKPKYNTDGNIPFEVVMSERERKLYPNLIDDNLISLAQAIADIDYGSIERRNLKAIMQNLLKNRNIKCEVPTFDEKYSVRVKIFALPGNDYVSEVHPLSIEFFKAVGTKVLPAFMYWGKKIISFDKSKAAMMVAKSTITNDCQHMVAETGETALHVTNDGNVECSLCKQKWTK